MHDLEIRPLTTETWPEFADWFGSRDTSPDCRWCWCAFWRIRGRDWTNSTADENRAVLEQAVDALSADSRAPGLVAYRDGEPVGWVSLGPRPDYDRIVHSTVLAPIDERPVWSIVCFVVGRRVRGQGVARALLDAAVAYARGRGARLLEAYPVDTADGRVPAANAYRGTLSMFEAAGFTEVTRRQANRNSPPRPIVRLELR